MNYNNNNELINELDEVKVIINNCNTIDELLQVGYLIQADEQSYTSYEGREIAKALTKRGRELDILFM